MSKYHVGYVDDFPEGEGVAVDAGGVDVAVFNVGGELFAIHNNCPHKNLPLAEAGQPRFIEGPDPATDTRGAINADSCTINCPWHRLEFSLTDGHSPLLDYNIPTYEVVTEGEKVIIRR
ncbi:Rieske (2Fe-2S) protein [Halomarina salina]|uniref:Rieske (2Fe-2S) protein n=1 Tax=Halomarina salina TaxID=1872699 RepID=A0ABD5RTR3_9EURY